MKKCVLICEFHQESDTFNPIVYGTDSFASRRYAKGSEAYDICKKLPCAFHGMIDAVEKNGGEVIPSISLYGGSGGRVADETMDLFKKGVKETLEACGKVDAVCASLHGAMCSESFDDACGEVLTFIRGLVGEGVPVAASFDLHANITDQMLGAANILCGYQSYPHVDFYETGYRAASLCMRILRGEPTYLASVDVPLLAPPAGYTSLEEPFKSVIERGKKLVAEGTLLDFTVFNVQPWLDVENIRSNVLAVADTEKAAKKYAEEIAKAFFDARDGYMPDLMSIDEIIDLAESESTKKPVILADAADSPNGGAVGDSVSVALRMLERGSKITMGMFVVDPEAAAKAFEIGVGGEAMFEVGGKFTPGMPGPIKAMGRVRSLHDGFFRQEGPAGKGFANDCGKTAVISFGGIDMMVCEKPGASGDPQILRHFGIEPKLYDLIVVKANMSFKVAYAPFAGVICAADTPGAGASNLGSLKWTKLPHGLYPFDLPDGYVLAPARLWKKS